MAKNKKFEAKNVSNFRREKKSLELIKDGTSRKQFLVFSLKNLDKTQSDSFEEWEETEILAKALNRVHGFCRMTLQEGINSGLLKIYGKGIPPKSKFKLPNHISEDVEWASIRIQGKERIIGYVEHHFIFQVVFLDLEHLFYPSHKKNT